MINVISRLSLAALMFMFSYSAYSADNADMDRQKSGSTLKKSEADMNSYLSIFEIPATDISRAIEFYQAILDMSIEKVDMPGMEMGILPYEEQAVTGVILKEEGLRPPMTWEKCSSLFKNIRSIPRCSSGSMTWNSGLMPIIG